MRYKRDEADDEIWSDDLGYVKKREHPSYEPDPDEPPKFNSNGHEYNCKCMFCD